MPSFVAPLVLVDRYIFVAVMNARGGLSPQVAIFPPNWCDQICQNLIKADIPTLTYATVVFYIDRVKSV